MNLDQARRLRSLDARVLGSRLRDARVAAGLTQAQVSRPEFSPAHLSRIESGQRRPSARLLEGLILRLSITLDDLIHDRPDSFFDLCSQLFEAEWLALEDEYQEAHDVAVDVERKARNAGQTTLAARAALTVADALIELGNASEAEVVVDDLLNSPGPDAQSVRTHTTAFRVAVATGNRMRAESAAERGSDLAREQYLDALPEGVAHMQAHLVLERHHSPASGTSSRRAVADDVELPAMDLVHLARRHWAAARRAQRLGLRANALHHAHAAILLRQTAKYRPR